MSSQADTNIKPAGLDKSITTVSADSVSLPTDFRKPLRLGVIFLVVGFGGFLLWAFFAPIDSGSVASANVVVDGRRKTVQHFSGGVIKKIHVKEGDFVKKDALLVTMDNSISQANKSSVQAQLRALEVQISYLDKLISDLNPMVQDGFYPRNKVLELQRQRAEADSERVGLTDKLSASSLELDRTLIRAPAAGRVMGLAFTTEGGVVSPGGKLLDLVPENEQLVLEGQIQPHLIDKITPGLTAEVRFSALNLRSTPVILGAVQWVSADRFQNPEDSLNPQGFFTVRVIVEKSELSKLRDAQIRAGMPAELVIKTGERTFFNYLIKPLSDRMATALKEN